MSGQKPKVGDVIKTDAKFDYVVTQTGPKLLYNIQYENLEENFTELVPAEKVKDMNDKYFNTKDTSVNFVGEGDKVKAELFGEWKTAVVQGIKFGEFEITCFKKGTKKAYFSEWIIIQKEQLSDGEEKTVVAVPKPKKADKTTDIKTYLSSTGFDKIKEKVDSIMTSEHWDTILSNLTTFFIKPQWDGQPLGDEFHVFILACSFDTQFTDRLRILLENSGLRVTSNEEEIHISRVLLLLYTDNASYDARLIRLLTRGAELANSGELCISVLVHPTCSAFRQNRIPDNMAYSLADSKWYNWIGVDAPDVSFDEMVHQIKSYTCKTHGESTLVSGIWYCKVVVSGDYCSNFYDNRSMTLYLYEDKEGKIKGQTPSGLILEGDFDKGTRILDITGAYCGPWCQENEGWKEDLYQIMIKIRGVLDYKGSKFEGQICEVSRVGGNVFECVGTLSATLENEGVSGFYEVTDALSEMKGNKLHMTLVQQRGGDLLVDLKGHFGTMYPGTIDATSRRFWLYVQNTPNSCTTYEGIFSSGNKMYLEATGSFFKCENGLTTLPKTKYTAKRAFNSDSGEMSREKADVFLQLVQDAQERSLRTSIINSFTYIPPGEEDFPVLIVGAQNDNDTIQKLKFDLVKAGIGPISSDPGDLESCRTVCLIMSPNIRDNVELIETIKCIAAKDIPFFIIASDSRRNIFNDDYWSDLDLKEKLLSCLARLKQTGKKTLDPSSLLFKTLVNEIKSNYKPPVYHLSGLWSVKTFTKNESCGYNEAAADARKGKVRQLNFPKIVYILTDGVSGKVVAINDFVSNKQFKGTFDNREGTFTFDNEDSKYELVIERDGATMQGTYINRVHNIQMEISLTLEIDDISGIYTIKEQNQIIGIVKTGHLSVDVYYRNYVLPGVFSGSRFYCTIPRSVNRKPVLSTMCGTLQKSMSGSSLVCFEFASLANMKCLSYQYEYLQTRFQKLDEGDKINVTCEPYVLDFIEQYIEAFNDVNYQVYKDLHAESSIEAEEVYEAYCRHTHDIIGKIGKYNFVGKRKMMETNLSHLSISRYEFDMEYESRLRREFFIIDENCLLRGTMSLEEEALQFHSSIYDVMITYRSTDSGWADLLQAYLESNEILCWRDQRMEIGANWSSDITSAIRLAKCELCLLSEDYLKSEMCTKEISLAFDSGKLIIPLVLPYTDQTKKRPLVKSTYKPPYPPHQISHETSQSTWIDFRPVSSEEKDPDNRREFQDLYNVPLKVLVDRLQLSKTRSHICDINGCWILRITDSMGRRMMTQIALEYIGRIPNGVVQDDSGKPIARLSPQSVIKGTRLLLFFVNPKTNEMILGIKAMMSGDNR